jgi:hypothetical protein
MVDGLAVERDALRVAEAIKDYDPNLEVLCVEDHMAGISEEPFVIAEKGADGVLRPVLRAWELNDQVLQRIIAADKVTLKSLENLEAERKIKGDTMISAKRLRMLFDISLVCVLAIACVIVELVIY